MSDEDENNELNEYGYEDEEDAYVDNEHEFDDDDSRKEDDDDEDNKDDEFHVEKSKKMPRKSTVVRTEESIERNVDLYLTFPKRRDAFERAFEECLKEAVDTFQDIWKVFGSRKLDKTLEYNGSMELSTHLLSVLWSTFVILTNVLFIDSPENFPKEQQTRWLSLEITNVMYSFILLLFLI